VSILITRGAGFIGSHAAKLFYEPGCEVGVLDNLVNGRRKNANWGTFIEGDISDTTLVRRMPRENSPS
jgi:UDP-glucose 4-epimerase